MLRFLWNHPMQRRVSLLTTVAVALAVIVFSVLGYLALRSTIVSASQGIARGIAEDLVAPVAGAMSTTGSLPAELRQPGGVLVEVLGPDGSVLTVPGEQQRLVVGPEDREATGPAGTTVERIGEAADGERYAVAAVPLPGTGSALLVARPLAPVLEILRVQRLILLGVSIAGILTAAVVGVAVGLSGLRPMRRLTEAVEHVTATQDYQPIASPYAKGDLATPRHLVQPAAGLAEHDAGAPVAPRRRRRARAADPVDEHAHQRGPAAVRRAPGCPHRRGEGAVLGDLQGQLGELADMVGDLVHVARDDSALALAPLDVRDVVESSLDRVRRRALGATFDVALDPLFVVANADSLGRAVTNLLDNAVKWSPAGGVIRVRLVGNRLQVSDAGPGIPDADLPYVFDRFFRGETGRKTKGTGLGLSIVAKTMDEMGGTVVAGRSAEGGASSPCSCPASRAGGGLPPARPGDGLNGWRRARAGHEGGLPAGVEQGVDQPPPSPPPGRGPRRPPRGWRTRARAT